MSRPNARPGLGAVELEMFAQRQEILLNPGEDDIGKALVRVQKRCRRNLLTPAEAIEVYRRVALQGGKAAHAGIRECPRGFDFGINSTVVQAVRLSDALIGVWVGRPQVLPGQVARPPVWADSLLEPMAWLNQVVTAFWTYLTDEQIAELRHRAVSAAMELAAESQWREGHERGERRAGIRRRLQLQALFKRAEPVYMPELDLALRRVAESLGEQRMEQIDWRSFQQRWPSIAARYKRDLLGIFRQGTARAADLAQYRQRCDRYTVDFTTWSGLQTVFAATQIVFQICSPLLADGEQPGAPGSKRLRESLRKRAEKSFHPVTPETVGWLRVHVDDAHRLCFVDEVQSDVLEYLLALAPSDDGAAELSRALSDWQTHGFSTVQHWASCIGYRVAIHSRESAAYIEGKTASDRKWNIYYGSLIKRFGLEKARVEGYPAAIFVES